MDRLRMIGNDALILLKTFFRQKSTIVWIIVIPLILTVMCCSVIAAFDTQAVYVYVQDQDESPISQKAITTLEDSVTVVMVDKTLSLSEARQMMEDDGRNVIGLIVFNKGFKDWVIDDIALKGKASFMVYTTDSSYEIGIEVKVDPAKKASNDKLDLVMNFDLFSGEETKSKGSLVEQIFGAGANLYEMYSAGMTIALVCEVLLGLTIGMSSSMREKGVTKMIRTTELKKWHTFFAYCIWAIIPTIVVAGVTLSIVFLYSPVTIGPMTIVFTLLSGLCAASMGLAVSLLVRNSQSASIAASAVLIPLLIVSGALVPSELMPGWFQILSYVSPLTFMVSGFKSSMGIYTSLDPGLCVLVLVAFILLFGTIWMIFENRASE